MYLQPINYEEKKPQWEIISVKFEFYERTYPTLPEDQRAASINNKPS